MKFLLIYYSTTGNTKEVSRRIGEILKTKNHQVDVFDWRVENKNILDEKCSVDFESWKDYDCFGIGSPTWSFAPPQFFLDFLNSLPSNTFANKFYFVFSTHAGAYGKTNKNIAKLINKLGGLCVGSTDIQGPPNYPPFGKPIGQRKHLWPLESFEHLESFVNNCLENIEKHETVGVSNSSIFAGFIGSIVFPWMLKSGRNLRINPESCILCQSCVNYCPVNAIKSVEEVDGVITLDYDQNLCVKCYGCCHICPKGALDFSDSLGKEKYLFNKRILTQSSERFETNQDSNLSSNFEELNSKEIVSE
eukprot:TRINITY_DN13867_c0_g1_i1.p1 TRINITY_DN13867_c0_g1~~TRINITY_DN13867_c0_g1_i1.p1  ORF type:complete len:305 (+),score=79.53 TRINITY_DN13867_c0_g1_i1:33-947(+)